MTTRELRPQERPAPPSGSDDNQTPQESRARETGDAFLQAADAALARALSGRPEAFLAQNRQLNGQ